MWIVRLALRRPLSVAVMALAIRAAIDAVAYRLADEPDLDLAAYARELATMFDQATAAWPAGARQADVQPESRRD